MRAVIGRGPELLPTQNRERRWGGKSLPPFHSTPAGQGQADGRTVVGNATSRKVDAIWTINPLRMKSTGALRRGSRRVRAEFSAGVCFVNDGARRSRLVVGAPAGRKSRTPESPRLQRCTIKSCIYETWNLSHVVLFIKFTYLDNCPPQEEVGGLRMRLRIIPAIARLGVPKRVEQTGAPGGSSLTVSRDAEALPGADNVGKRMAGGSNLLRKDSARISDPNNISHKVTLVRTGVVTTFASLAPAARSRTGRGGAKRSPFPFLGQPDKCLLRCSRWPAAVAG